MAVNTLALVRSQLLLDRTAHGREEVTPLGQVGGAGPEPVRQPVPVLSAEGDGRALPEVPADPTAKLSARLVTCRKS
jgi:hypothetical protein